MKEEEERVLKPWDRCEATCWSKSGKAPCPYRARHLLQDGRAMCGIHLDKPQPRKKPLFGSGYRGGWKKWEK